jgi:enoyl-CoA hydratase/carnithine racemase
MTSPIRITKPAAGYYRVTLDNPPLNLLDPGMIKAFGELIDELEADVETKVVVFDSADPDFFMAHFDLLRAAEVDPTPRASGLATFPDFIMRLEHAPFMSIGSLRGRARGAGGDLLSGLDMRFASREKGVLSQPEVGCGLFPGGGALERIPLHVNRARALEIVIGADDIDADTAALYGWINRAIPDAELDDFVDRLARRIASWDKPAIAAAKQAINDRSRMTTSEFLSETQKRFFEFMGHADARARVARLLKMGLQVRGATEYDLPRFLQIAHVPGSL